MKGQFVRSQLQWLQDGERPYKYLSGLENKKFIEKTIKKVKLNNGDVITEQEEVLHQVQKYYVNIFENRDDRLQEINLEKLGIKSDIKVPEENIGFPLTVEELGQV